MEHEQLCAWAAGFFDGEGHVSVHPNGQRGFNMSLETSNTDIRPLERLREHWGGKIETRTMSSANRRQPYRWILACGEAETFALDCMGLCAIKGEQLRLYLQMRTLTGLPYMADQRLELANAMKELRRA